MNKITVDPFTKSLVKKIELSAVVLKRCECGQGQFGWSICPSCGRDAVTIDHGVIASYKRPWYNRAWDWLTQ